MPPATPQPPPPPDPPAPTPGAAEDRISALEAEQKRQGGMLEQILNRLPGPGGGGGGQAPAAATGSVAEQVRAGIAELEREKAAAAETDTARQAREDHAARLAALEERMPGENAATPVGAFRGRVQKYLYGLDDTRR